MLNATACYHMTLIGLCPLPSNTVKLEIDFFSMLHKEYILRVACTCGYSLKGLSMVFWFAMAANLYTMVTTLYVYIFTGIASIVLFAICGTR